MGSTMADMQFDQLKRTTRLELCCLWGVPPVVAGWVDAAGDSSAYTQNSLAQFYQETIFPLLDGDIAAIQEIAARFDPAAVAWFDVDDQPIVQQMRLARADTAVKYFALGVPFNAINESLDLGLPALDWGDMGFLPAGLIPAADIIAGNVVPPMDEPPEEPEEEQPQRTQRTQRNSEQNASAASAIKSSAQAARTWRAWAASWSPLARTVTTIIRNRIVAQERILIAGLKAEPSIPAASGLRLQASGSATEHVTPKPEALSLKSDSDDVASRLVMSISHDGKTWKIRVRKFIADAHELGIRQALAEAGLSGPALEEAVKRLLSDPRILRAIASESVVISTRVDGTTRRILRNQLSEGLANGETLRELTDRVQSVMGNRRDAAWSTAANSIGQSLSISRNEAQRDSGATHKGWVYSRGSGHRRPAHIEAERVYLASPIPFDEPFMINGQALMFPRDFASGAVDECVNCQCLQVARRIKKQPQRTQRTQRAELDDFYPERFVGYDEMLAARKQIAAEENHED
jgi:hypothetical protein